MKRKGMFAGLLLSSLAWAVGAWADNVYTIYPVPHEQVAGTGNVGFTSQVNVVCESGIDDVTRQRVESVLGEHGLETLFSDAASSTLSNVYLGLNGSGGAADRKAAELGLGRDVFAKAGKYDRHVVSLTAEGGRACLVVLGEHTDAAFYGLASVEQMLDGGTTALPCVTINDYADQQLRGVVEGYYGLPYSNAVRKDLLRFMMRHKMNSYLYGVKSDPYHSQHVYEPYPTTLTAEQEANNVLSQDMVRDLTSVSKETKVNFIWAIHVRNGLCSGTSIVPSIMGKYESMYDLGVRQFAVFTDDAGVPGTETEYRTQATRLNELQEALEAKYNVAGAAPEDTVRPVHFVPQPYALSWTSTDGLRLCYGSLGELAPKIVVYITGWGVWTVPNNSDFDYARSFLGRNVAWWWNYPCNDNADDNLFPMDMYTNFSDMPSIDGSSRLPSAVQNGLGILCNPMQQGEVSKIPLFSAADYAWNNAGFSSQASWSASFDAILSDPEAAAAYRTLAPYLRSGDSDELNQLIQTYKLTLEGGQPNPAKLQARIEELRTACAKLAVLETSEQESDRLLYGDFKPWFLRLKTAVDGIGELLEVASLGDDAPEKWSLYAPQATALNGLDTDEDYMVRVGEGMGSEISIRECLALPSNDYLLPFAEYMKKNALGDLLSASSAFKLVSNKSSVRGSVSVSKSVVSAMLLPTTVAKDEYVGIELPVASKISSLTVDESLLSSFSLMCSTDGKTWTRVEDVAQPTDDFVKYLVLLNESDGEQTLTLNSSKFSFVCPQLPAVDAVTVPEGDYAEGTNPASIADGDYDTFFAVNKNQEQGDAYRLTLSEEVLVSDVRVYIGTKNGDYMNSGKVQISSDGENWTDLTVKGTTQTSFSMNMSQVNTYSDQVKYCDFSGVGQSAKYVRLYVSGANTSKWLRLYEIEVNKQTYPASTSSVCTDGLRNRIDGLTDGLGYTSFETKAHSLTYAFQKINYLRKVRIYQDAAAASGTDVPVIKVTTDGTNWTEKGKLTESAQEVDMTDCPLAKAMRIEWTSVAPRIYEIVEEPDPDRQISITGISPVQLANGVDLRAQGRRLSLQASQGVRAVCFYTADGKLLQSRRFGNETSLHLSVPATAQGVVLVKVETADGCWDVYKLLVD